MISPLPELATLTHRLTAALSGKGFPGGQVTILDRKTPPYLSTFPYEIVTCRLADGSKRRLFCKYAAGHNHNAHGHRGGIAYEAKVYRHILLSLQDSRPLFHGAHTDKRTGETWLILEYLDRCIRVKDITPQYKKMPRPLAMILAARWVGRFHATYEAHLARSALSLSFLNQYDVEYYRGWVRRTQEFAGPLNRRFPWLAKLCKRADELLAPLLAPPLTVIHGEFYTNNLLLRYKSIYPVDWESTAIAAGEIDLAALTEGHWPVRTVRQCELEYQRARWPQGPPASFERKLEAARLYLHFRWLGDRPDWTIRKTALWRFKQLQMAAEHMGLV